MFDIFVYGIKVCVRVYISNPSKRRAVYNIINLYKNNNDNNFR